MVKVEHTEYGHITEGSHNRAKTKALDHGIVKGVVVMHQGHDRTRTLRVEWIEAHWTGAVVVGVRNLDPPHRLSNWRLDRLVTQTVQRPSRVSRKVRPTR